ncbi:MULTISPECIES: hypothetical protein [Dickeya]|uniref:hypothetical protein n=1 Tax=Dickeya TaxID=204037 RepID=UPI0003A4908A|nr:MULTISPECIES: hypothetical protein [Dickeya]TYL43051.1 hypothetical protein FDP13_10090 [Dickeya sp. ws52]
MLIIRKVSGGGIIKAIDHAVAYRPRDFRQVPEPATFNAAYNLGIYPRNFIPQGITLLLSSPADKAIEK